MKKNLWQIFNREDPVAELQDLVEDQDEKIRCENQNILSKSKSDLSAATSKQTEKITKKGF